jgi:adenine-specific DNA-methyltransferase
MGSLFKSISSVIQKHSTADGTRELNSLMGGVAFTFPKPTALISDLIEQATGESDIVLDFFAGSGTTADATLKLNSKDGGNRRFIAVQIPEQIDRSNRGESDAARLCDEMGVPRNIAELSKERIRRAGRRLLESVGEKDWNKDVGFRVLKIDSSNMADVFYTPDATSQKDLLKSVDNIKPDRTPEDLLFHVLVDWGVDLTLPISREIIEGKAVFSVAGTALMACFDSGVDEALVTKLAERQPMRVVFKDTGFKDDATKINVRQIFKSLSPDTEVKAI